MVSTDAPAGAGLEFIEVSFMSGGLMVVDGLTVFLAYTVSPPFAQDAS
jgi:hypothetical protein